MTEAAPRTLKPLSLSRTFHAPMKAVFAAWTTAESVSRWFPPMGYTAPEARVELTRGGPFEVLMQSPAGERHWARGVVTDVVPPERLVIDFLIEDASGRALFRALTEVRFSEAIEGTRLDVTQSYTVLDAESAWMAEGAPQGWAQTLDKLADEVHRLHAPGEPGRSVVHAAFTVERTYDAPAARVWRALSDVEAKAKWFGGPPDQWREMERVMDFRVGGAERAKGRFASGVVSSFEAVYHDIVAEARIVFSYVMRLDERKISVSLATMELAAAGPGRTRLKVTEQGAFLDGYDDAGSRERGTAYLLDKLGASLE